ncbi:MAG: heparinase II/III family protein [Eubacteriales bacterium]
MLALRQSHDSSKGLYLGIKGGHNSESHNHNDVGSFVVYKDGAPVFVDAGVGTYTAQTFSSRRYEIWTMQSSYHNLPEINGTQQSPGRQFEAKEVSFSPEDMSIEMDIAGAYPSGAGVRGWTRNATMSSDGITVSDRYKLKEDGEVVFNLLTLERPDISVRGIIKVAGAVTQYGNGLSATVEEIPLEDSKLRNGWGTDRLWRVRLAGRVSAEGESVLVIR